MLKMKYLKNIIAVFLFIVLRMIFYIKKYFQEPTKQILFVNLGLLGDAVLSSVILANDWNIKTNYSITLLLSDKNKALFENYNGKIIINYVDKNSYRKSIRYRLSTLNYLFNNRYEKVYNLSFGRLAIDDEVSIIAGLFGETFAFPNNKNLSRVLGNIFNYFYTKILERGYGNDSSIFISLLKNAVNPTEKIVENTVIYSQKIDIEQKFNLKKNSYFVVSPFSSYPIKNWNLEKYIWLCKSITSKLKLNCVIVGNEGLDLWSAYERSFSILLEKTDLTDVINIIRYSQFFIGNDSGLLHVAITLKKISFGIVGGGVWGRIYPYDSNNKSHYFYSYRSCFNCDWNCIYKTPKCLVDVNKNEVLEYILKTYFNKEINSHIF